MEISKSKLVKQIRKKDTGILHSSGAVRWLNLTVAKRERERERQVETRTVTLAVKV